MKNKFEVSQIFAWGHQINASIKLLFVRTERIEKENQLLHRRIDFMAEEIHKLKGIKNEE